MKKHIFMSISVITIITFFIPSFLFAEVKTFLKEYVYQASEADSKISCRTIALEQTKRLLLEEIGTYLESVTEVKNYQLTKDQITALTAGVTKTTIIKENWDGKNYFLKAEIRVDPEGVVKSIDDYRKDRQKERELADERKKTEEALNKLERLKKELEQHQKDEIRIKQYKEAVQELTSQEYLDKGRKYLRSGKFREAQASLKESIKLNPVNPWAYYYSGMISKKLGRHRDAIIYFSTAINQDPSFAWAYYNRGLSYNKLGNQEHALADIKEAARLGDKYAQNYLNTRGVSHNTNRAVLNHSKKGGFVASKNSTKFHRLDCKWAKRISVRNRIHYKTIEEATASGKMPCRICNPMQAIKESPSTKYSPKNNRQYLEDPALKADFDLDQEVLKQK